jgi:ATP-dependent helicase IRC3
LAKYDPARYRGVIVDEAHHAVAPRYVPRCKGRDTAHVPFSYIKLLSHFNSNVNANANIKAVRGDFEDPKVPQPRITKLAIPRSEEIDSSSSAPSSATSANVPIIGFTATFSRHDDLALSQVFEEIVFHRDVVDMLEAGWLAPARFTTVQADLDFSKLTVKSSSKDFSPKSLAAVMNTPAVNELIVEVYLDHASKFRPLKSKNGADHPV